MTEVPTPLKLDDLVRAIQARDAIWLPAVRKQALAEPDAVVQATLCTYLGVLGNRSDAPCLGRLLSSPDPAVAGAALKSLARLGLPVEAAAFADVLGRGDRNLTLLALSGLGAQAPDGFQDQVLSAAEGISPQARSVLAGALAELTPHDWALHSNLLLELLAVEQDGAVLAELAHAMSAAMTSSSTRLHAVLGPILAMRSAATPEKNAILQDLAGQLARAAGGSCDVEDIGRRYAKHLQSVDSGAPTEIDPSDPPPAPRRKTQITQRILMNGLGSGIRKTAVSPPARTWYDSTKGLALLLTGAFVVGALARRATAPRPGVSGPSSVFATTPATSGPSRKSLQGTELQVDGIVIAIRGQDVLVKNGNHVVALELAVIGPQHVGERVRRRGTVNQVDALGVLHLTLR